MLTQDIRFCLPVKILEKQWAEKLLDGSVFMRSLYDFRIMDNSFRGDINEGILRNINPKIGDSFFNTRKP